MRYATLLVSLVLPLLSLSRGAAQAPGNLVPDPSLEQTRAKNQFGVPFARWSGWIFEGGSEFRVGRVAHSGATSGEMVGAIGGKIRLYTPAVRLEPGLYRMAIYVRGLDVGPGLWGTNEDLSFADDTYYPLKLAGNFGWTRLELVKKITAAQDATVRVGLWGQGRLWVDDASITRVPDDTPVSAAPAVAAQEAPIAPPAALDAATAVACPECGYRNMPAWGRCYACGEALATGARPDLPPVRKLASFEDGTIRPFDGSTGHAVAEHATDGQHALRLDREYLVWDGAQDWSGYDFWKADVYNASPTPTTFYFEVRDAGTTDYWTRVNYYTTVPPGASTLIIPIDLYVGEKSRPGRPLDKAHVTRLAVNIDQPKGPLYLDNIRLERDLSDRVKVPGLRAFAFGPGVAPPLRGFTAVTPSTNYSAGRGYGLKDAQIWRAYDAKQPDPLYGYGLCIERGGFAVDLPNGRYHVFVNLDSPSGFWGEYQVYRERVVKANGVEVVHDRMDLASFVKRYFRFAETEDSPKENTFDKYQVPYFQEKQFDVEVKGGQLYLEFLGENWANFVSALVIYPADQSATGQAYLANLRERRRFYFDNDFKRVLADGSRDAAGPIPAFVPTAQEKRSGLVLWARDWMQDVPVNAVPRRAEVTRHLAVFASAGQMQPIVFSVTPLRDLGAATVTVSDLVGPGGARVPAAAVKAGVVSHRITRVTSAGTVYTIAPRFVMARASASLRQGVTSTFWLTLHTPARVKAGAYTGRITLRLADGRGERIALSVRLFATPLDPLDVPAGPWGCSIDLPWYGEETAAYNAAMLRKCLAKMREYGLTAFSGIPSLSIRGWKEGKPDIDFSRADQEMAAARAAGFKMVVNYNGGIRGFDNYFKDENAMRAAGFSNYVDFLRPVLAAVQEHARAANWLPAGFNLCDEPLGDDARRAAENAQAWREAAPAGLITTGATSIESPKPDNEHLPLVKALRMPNLNGHDEAAIRIIHDAGNDWAFYNGGDRWTFGAYMYKCAKEFGMKLRLSWHWNACAGDPYYALDCREDDYAWCVANAKGELVPSLHFERDIRAGVDDYRYMQTLARLLRERPNSPAAPAARKLVADKLSAFHLGDRDHNAKWPSREYGEYQRRVAEAIEAMGR